MAEAPAVVMDAAQLDQLLAAIPAPQPPAPKKRLTPFSSSDANSWSAWKRTYAATRKLNGWDNAASVDQLAAALEGDASSRASGINFAIDNPATTAPWTIEDAIKAIDDLFLPKGSGRLAQSLFDQAKQIEGESILDWHSRLRALFERAYPAATLNTSPEIIKRFVMNLRSPALIKDVLTQDPQTYEECLEVSSDKASILYTLQSKGLLTPSRTASTDVSAFGDIGAMEGSNPHADVECFKCHEYGHYRNDCPKWQEGQNRGGGRGGQGGQKGRGGWWRNKNRKKNEGQQNSNNNRGEGDRTAAISAMENALKVLTTEAKPAVTPPTTASSKKGSGN